MDSTRKNTIEDQPKTPCKDRIFQLVDMAGDRELTDKKRSRNLATAVREQMFAGLLEFTRKLTVIKLTFLTLGGNMEEYKARAGKIGTEEEQAHLAHLWQLYVELEESLPTKQEQHERAVEHENWAQREVEYHERLSTWRDTRMRALFADIDSRLDDIVVYLTCKEEETWSEIPEGKAETKDDTSQGKTEAEDDTPEEKAETQDDTPHGDTEAEDDTPLDKAETEDDIRVKALFAEHDRVQAQIKSLGTYPEFKAQNDAFFKSHDEGKAQRLGDALKEVQETS